MEKSNSEERDARFWYRFANYKYTFLVLSIVFLFFTMPMVEQERHFLPFLFLLVMATVLWSLSLHTVLLSLCLVLGFLGFGLHLSTETIGFSEATSRVLKMVERGAYTLFYGISLLVFLHRIFSEKMVTADTIQGGIAVYFLSGLLWAFFYHTLFLFHSDAISLSDQASGEFSDMIYFSFITLTTLGYGDITPVSQMAKTLTLLEAVWGQTYLAVLVARLVGLHLSGSNKSDHGNA